MATESQRLGELNRKDHCDSANNGTMTRSNGLLRKVTISALGFVALILIAALSVRGQAPSRSAGSNQELPALIRSTKGADLFRAYCASCHGVDAKGNGPAASALKTKAPDLTSLERKNGGTFPAARVRKTITGEDVIASHGSREMPIWGPIFHQVEEDIDRGNVRIENLVKYLESIQVPH